MKFTMKLCSEIRNLRRILNAPAIKTNYAPHAWRCLNGQICVYKPAGLTTAHVANIIKTNICKGKL